MKFSKPICKKEEITRIAVKKNSKTTKKRTKSSKK